jgi:hypothetical protein
VFPERRVLWIPDFKNQAVAAVRRIGFLERSQYAAYAVPTPIPSFLAIVGQDAPSALKTSMHDVQIFRTLTESNLWSDRKCCNFAIRGGCLRVNKSHIKFWKQLLGVSVYDVIHSACIAIDLCAAVSKMEAGDFEVFNVILTVVCNRKIGFHYCVESRLPPFVIEPNLRKGPFFRTPCCGLRGAPSRIAYPLQFPLQSRWGY